MNDDHYNAELLQYFTWYLLAVKKLKVVLDISIIELYNKTPPQMSDHKICSKK